MGSIHMDRGLYRRKFLGDACSQLMLRVRVFRPAEATKMASNFTHPY